MIKKSVLDIERKLDYARIVMRVLKECKLVKEFIEYTATDNYINFSKTYTRKSKECSDVWYDRNMCASILGCCNFSYYMVEKYGSKKGHEYSPYHLVLCYLAIFNKEEYIRYARRFGENDWVTPTQCIWNALNNTESVRVEEGLKDAEIVKNWLTLKEILYGDKN